MPVASTDFPIGIGGSADVFPGQSPDDMHDVPLHNSLPAATVQSSQLKASTPTATAAHLHFPPTFKPPERPCGLAVRVHTPETVSQTTMGIPISHTVYHVETKSTLSAFPKPDSAVLRRFSDFDALYSALRARYTGYFIPTLPDKAILQGKVLADKAFLDKRTQDLEVFINECCRHEVIQGSTVLQLFLTLESDSLPTHPQWKRAEDEQCVFHSLSVLRKSPVAMIVSNDRLPSPAPAKSTIGKLSSTLFSGVSYLTGKIVPSTAVHDNTPASPQSVDAAQRGDTLVRRACAVDGLLLRWAQVMHALHCTGLAAQELAAEFHRLWAYEEKASAHVKLLPVARQLGNQYKKVSYNAAHVGKGVEAHAKAGDNAAAPLRKVASGMHAGRRALEDRYELRGAIAEAQRVVQEKREKYRAHSPEVAAGQQAGLEEVQRAIAILDTRIQEMQSDYSAMCDVHKSEAAKLEGCAGTLGPLSVAQVASLMEGLAVSTAQQWETLAQSLGADVNQ